METPTPERLQYLAQRGLQWLPCGCIVTVPGSRTGLIVPEPCKAIAPILASYKAAAREVKIGDDPKTTPAAGFWASVVAHVAEERRVLTTGKRPARKKTRGLGR